MVSRESLEQPKVGMKQRHPHLNGGTMATKAKDGKCACPGPVCGDQTYGEMFETMKAVHMGQGQSIENLRQIHLKWKRIGAQVR